MALLRLENISLAAQFPYHLVYLRWRNGSGLQLLNRRQIRKQKQVSEWEGKESITQKWTTPPNLVLKSPENYTHCFLLPEFPKLFLQNNWNTLYLITSCFLFTHPSMAPLSSCPTSALWSDAFLPGHRVESTLSAMFSLLPLLILCYSKHCPNPLSFPLFWAASSFWTTRKPMLTGSSTNLCCSTSTWPRLLFNNPFNHHLLTHGTLQRGSLQWASVQV